MKVKAEIERVGIKEKLDQIKMPSSAKEQSPVRYGTASPN